MKFKVIERCWAFLGDTYVLKIKAVDGKKSNLFLISIEVQDQTTSTEFTHKFIKTVVRKLKAP